MWVVGMKLEIVTLYDNNNYYQGGSSPGTVETASFFDTSYPTTLTTDLTAAKDYKLSIPVVRPLNLNIPVHRFLDETTRQRYVLASTGYTAAPAYTTIKVRTNGASAGDIVGRVTAIWFVQWSHRVR